MPPTERIRAELAALGVERSDLHPAEQQRIGSAEYVGTTPPESRCRFACSGATRRTPSGSPATGASSPIVTRRRSVAVGRLEQVEHEALATLMAAQAGVRVPEVVTAALGPRATR